MSEEIPQIPQLDEKEFVDMMKRQQRTALSLSGSLFKTLSTNEQYFKVYATMLKRLYDELIGVGFTEEQAFEIVKCVVHMIPPVKII